jgi:hypothetical protein
MSALIPTSMDQAMKLAEMMSRGRLVPEHLRNPSDALMVVEMAMRFGMSPFAVAQATSVIQGKLMLEGKLVAAALNASGILASRLDYIFDGSGPGRSVTVTGVLRGETKERAVSVTLQEAKTSNGMWTKQPDQQLVYAGTRVWARRHAPEVMLGVYAPEEFDHDMPAKEPPHNGPTIEHEKPAATIANGNSRRDEINRETPMGQRAAAADTPRPPRQVATTAYDTAWLAPLDEQDPAVWIVNLERVLAGCTSQTEVTEAGGHVSVRNAVAKAPTDIRRRVSELLATHFARMAPPAEQEGDGWPSSEEATTEATA